MATTTMYKVVYKPNAAGTPSENTVMVKWFKTYEDATEWSGKLGDRVLEVKQYDKPEHYPNAELDFS
jgi:hypothetical protein